MAMAETSLPAATIDEMVTRVQALMRAARNGPPPWASHDLTFGQLRLLFVLQSGAVSIGRLAQMLGVTDATASEIVDRLVRRGLVTRSHRPDDRRVVDCLLSEDGARLLAEVGGARREVLRRALSVLDPDELAQFDGLLHTIAERLTAEGE
jgi:DNA-binding MarR family transcriptional regulator